jgi:2Fe-2S ferredoxin
MRAAVRNNVEGIAADCGGSLTCATCHVYVDPAWVDRLPQPGFDELDMLQFTAAERRSTSRLSCQLRMAEEFDGIRLIVPETQY